MLICRPCCQVCSTEFVVSLMAVPLASLFKSSSCEIATSTYYLLSKVSQETRHPVMGGSWGRERTLCLQDVIITTWKKQNDRKVTQFLFPFCGDSVPLVLPLIWVTLGMYSYICHCPVIDTTCWGMRGTVEAPISDSVWGQSDNTTISRKLYAVTFSALQWCNAGSSRPTVVTPHVFLHQFLWFAFRICLCKLYFRSVMQIGRPSRAQGLIIYD